MSRQAPCHPEFGALDVRKARELVDGFAPPEAPYRERGEPSWFGCDADRRTYWLRHAAEIVTWARNRSLGPPLAGLRYGVPHEAHLAIWTFAA
jgi:hypothetical protein